MKLMDDISGQMGEHLREARYATMNTLGEVLDGSFRWKSLQLMQEVRSAKDRLRCDLSY